MSSIRNSGDARHRRRLTTEVKAALRELNSQMSLLNRRFGSHIELKDADWTCLDLISLHGPLTPSALARLAGLHPATLTGILDRLQRAGWITRERDPDSTDRRAITIRTVKDRNPELYQMLSGMNTRMDDLCAAYSPTELELIADFLRRTSTAGQESAAELADG
ncbi:MarR family winged helix-turn-helix transcriptional regulator [Nocardia huaxiensis]|uniref:MarR family winged helix-turn-helix transcriptional regulator n=1 Tax=Nocardia huaxiensis TaxID=2755382 RepID=UPI001E3ADE70|nr:MarR family transcriptional regulator [Nocardia huaxiensis]UFS96682.1 MarR family transcriptional regulator [Nocardia huaxiensis]